MGARTLFEKGVNGLERVVIAVQEDPPAQVHDLKPGTVFHDLDCTDAWIPLWKVQGPDDRSAGIQIGVDVFSIEGMVSQGDRVYSMLEKPLGYFWRDPEPAGAGLSVRYDEPGLMLFD